MTADFAFLQPPLKDHDVEGLSFLSHRNGLLIAKKSMFAFPKCLIGSKAARAKKMSGCKILAQNQVTTKDKFDF